MAAIENVVLDNSADGSTISLVNATGLTSVTVQNAIGATDTTVASGVAVTLKANADATKAQVVDFGATATSASIVLNGVTTNTTVDVEAQGAKVTTLNIATTGAASTVGNLNVDAKMATVVITGDQNLTITDAVEEAVEVINASAFTGKLNVTTANQATTPDALVGTVDVTDITVTGGSGNDTINIAANAADNEVSVSAGTGDDKVVIKTAVAYSAATATNAGDLIAGGEGADTLSIDGDVSAADLSAVITGFEVLEFTADATGTDMSVNKLGITQFTMGDTIDVTLTGLAAASTATLSGAGTGADASTLTAAIGTDTTTDVLSVILESTGGTTASVLALTNYDTLNLSSTKATADAATVTNTLGSITSVTTSALNISGTQDLTITTAALKAAAVVTSTATGAVTSTFSTSVKTYTGGTGVDTLNLVAGDLKQGNTFAGGAGADKLSVTAAANQDLGIIGLTGFETVTLTSDTAVAANTTVGDFRNVTDLSTLNIVSGNAGDDSFTLNRLSADTTLTFGSNLADVVTTINTGTTQKVAFTGNYTVASLTLDSGTTSLTVTSDDGDATASEAGGVFSALSGTSLTSITVLGNDETDLGTLSTTVTSVNASAAKGTLTVTASATATTIVGSQDADTITGGAGNDTITGGKGIDTIDGGAGTDKIIFADTGANNGADLLTFTAGAGASADVMNFSSFLSGGSIDQNGAAGTAINEYGAADVADVNITNKVAFYTDATDANVNDTTDIANLIQGAGDAFSLTSGGKTILVTGDAGGATDPVNVWFVNDTLDGTAGTVSATDVVLVGTIALTDLDTLITSNFAFA